MCLLAKSFPAISFLWLLFLGDRIFVRALAPPSLPREFTPSRRSFLATAAGAAAAPSIVGNAVFDSQSVAHAASVPSVFEGMLAFASNKVEESVAIYDAIIRDDPKRKPFLWQRGLSLYYVDRFEDGADQFKTDVAVNPNDTEEQIWHLLCLAQTPSVGSLGKAREQKLTVGKDRRPVMRIVQKLFLGTDDGSEKELIGLAEQSFQAGDRFYAALYLSLYYESLKDEKASQKWMTNAVESQYAKTIGRRDPMVDVAKVAMQRRGW